MAKQSAAISVQKIVIVICVFVVFTKRFSIVSGQLSIASNDDNSKDDKEEQQIFSVEPAVDASLLPTAQFDYHQTMPVITKRELSAAIKAAVANVRKLRDTTERRLLASDRIQAPGSRAWLASSLLHKSPTVTTAEEAEKLFNQTNMALMAEDATRALRNTFGLSRVQVMRGLSLISVEATPLGKQCPRPARSFACAAGRFRSLSGHCNNVQSPDSGAAQTAYARFAPAAYADSVARPRRSSSSSVGGGGTQTQLPSAAAVSAAVRAVANERIAGTNSVPPPSSHLTTMMSFFGLFVAHDLAATTQFTGAQRSLIKCCDAAGRRPLPVADLHPECMQIELFDTGTNAATCIDYVRSTPAARAGCNLGARDQLNSATSYLDGSTIYGSSERQMRKLRTFVGGRLRTSRAPAALGNAPSASGDLLPLVGTKSENNDDEDTDTEDRCKSVATIRGGRSTGACFEAGDARVNDNIGLTLMHTIWMREHNYVADKLAALNKHWSDERIFEEARRVVGAELQYITYAEFLPAVLGGDVMQRFNLSVGLQGYFSGYEPSVSGATSNEAAAAALLPFLRSTVPVALERYSDRLEMLGSTSVADTFMDASDLFGRAKFGQYLMGLMSQNAMEPVAGAGVGVGVGASAATTRPRREQQQQNNTTTAAIDVVALTIQQGRDHGLRSYLYWRNACSLKPSVSSWQDLNKVLPDELVKRLRETYARVNDLDLYVALFEFALPGSSLGPTLVCILARQFYNTKHGDRYWFENDLPASAFSLAQLDQIRDTSLAKVVCRNSDASISFIQPAPMLASDPFLNAYQYCTNRAMQNSLDLSKWREPAVAPANQLANLVSSDFGEPVVGGIQAQQSRASRLRRQRQLANEATKLAGSAVSRAKRQLSQIARDEQVQLSHQQKTRQHATSSQNKPSPASNHHSHAGYRYLARPKRQALRINNASLVLELATNDVVRALIRRGRDREEPASAESDVRDFLRSLEAAQLTHLVDNAHSARALDAFVAAANGAFLEPEQRSRSSSLFESCHDTEASLPCDHTTPFRTMTGACNNLQRTSLGASFTPHDRLLPSRYDDGLGAPRSLSSTSSPTSLVKLPSPRLVTTTIHDSRSELHARYSLALMQFGQFGVDHDLTRTPFSVALDGSLLDCSACDSRTTVHRDCLPIEVPSNDPHFGGQQNQQQPNKCLHFVRSLNGQTGLGPRQQINALTAYLDASNVYGSDDCEARSLRTLIGGRLNSSALVASSNNNQQQQQQLKELLPVTRVNPECVTPQGVCFHAGDQRASEQPGLTAMHTLFMRMHNSIVDKLATINTHWNDEKLYQNGRRILGAVMQRVTFNEFAPRILGLDYMSKFDLLLKNVGYNDHYDDTCSASILTEFSAAAFRMGHSLIRNAFPLLDKQYKQIGKTFQLRKAFFNSQRIINEPFLMDNILRGIVSTPIESLDNSITDELTNHLFEKPREPFSGMDLISLNIQRARDHGIGGYNLYRAKCNLTHAKTFNDLADTIPSKLLTRLSSLYATVDDIDLFTGAMSESPVHGGIIGPTFGCIIGMQFSRLKKCDRFWHETSDPYVRFSPPQLAEIRKITLSKIICEHSDSIDAIQRNAMDISDHYLNPRVTCSSLPALNLNAWRENVKSCVLSNKTKLDLGQSKRISPCKSCTCTLEGPVCRTAKINCFKTMKQTTNLNAVMADKSCLVQCAWALEMQST